MRRDNGEPRRQSPVAGSTFNALHTPAAALQISMPDRHGAPCDELAPVSALAFMRERGAPAGAPAATGRPLGRMPHGEAERRRRAVSPS